MSSNDEKIKALSEQETEKLLGKEHFRKRINEIICEYVGTIDFMEKVRKHAGQEIDSRLFISGKFWLTTIFSALVSAGIGAAIIYFYGNK